MYHDYYVVLNWLLHVDEHHLMSYALDGGKFVGTYITKMSAKPLLCVTLR